MGRRPITLRTLKRHSDQIQTMGLTWILIPTNSIINIRRQPGEIKLDIYHMELFFIFSCDN